MADDDAATSASTTRVRAPGQKDGIAQDIDAQTTCHRHDDRRTPAYGATSDRDAVAPAAYAADHADAASGLTKVRAPMVTRWVLDLRRTSDPDAQRVVLFDDTVVVGRDPRVANLCVASAELSRRHASLQLATDGSALVRDLGTAGGLALDGQKVDGVPLTPGDALELGDWRLALVARPEPASAPPMVARLVPHPASTSHAIDAIEVAVQREDDIWTLRYALHGDLDALALPDPPLDPLRLWEHTCFELFARQLGTPRYEEWNFSPTGLKTRFAFTGYRERQHVDPEPRATLTFERAGAFVATVASPLRLAPSTFVSPCVITRDRAGGTAFWALEHAGDRPDFHAPSSFRQLALLGGTGNRPAG